MTKKETLQAEYKRIFGEDAPDTHTIKDLEADLKDTVFKEDDPIQEVKPKKSNLIQISNGRITKNVTKAQWRGMQDFKHDWKTKVNEPIEVQKLKDNAKTKK